MTAEFYTPEQIAQKIGTSVRALYLWRRRNVGPPFVTVGYKHVLYPVDGYEAWKKAQTHHTSDCAPASPAGEAQVQ